MAKALKGAKMSSSAKIRVSEVSIPTYEIGAYNKNPMFLEKRVYQGSSGKVYPHPVCETISDEKVSKKYTAVFLENDYILVMILPELGGRIQRLLDKTNNYDCVYYNEVIKPALVGLVGPWISGGIEFNWPQHHRPSTYDPVQYTVKENDDGSVTCFCGETEKMFHTRSVASFTVYPDKAYVEIKGRVYNPTEEPKTFLWWANPAVPVNDYTRSIFPPDVTAVYDHGKRDVSSFPIAKGVYYKVDYAPGTDISRYKNIPVPTSYMAHHSDYDFIGNYDDSKEAGLLHVADHHVSPGKKQWTWGNGNFGRAWDRNLTDENGPYIELMTGVFTDNQPDFTFIKPFEEKTFTQYFMPYKGCGAIKNATKDLAVNFEKEGDKAVVTLYASGSFDAPLTVKVFGADGKTFEKEVTLEASKAVSLSFNGIDPEKEGAGVRIFKGHKEILSYVTKHVEPVVPDPAKAMALPSDIKTTEELFLCGTHLEQYRHATFRPEDYYEEGLRRDPEDIRINNAYGKLLYKKGRFDESVTYFERAIKRSTLRNPNPYDCEPYYNLGLALKKTGDLDRAYDAFYKATWDGNFRGRGFYELSLLESVKGEYEKALEFAKESLEYGLHNYNVRTLYAGLLRKLGKKNEAIEFIIETLKADPLDMGSFFELYKLGERNDWKEVMRPDNEDYRELAILYLEAGFKDEACEILKESPKDNEPMSLYYLFFITDDKEYMEKAENADSLYCFPNRIKDIEVLCNAVSEGCRMAAYYLGCLMLDAGEWAKAQALWESVEDKISFPTVHRNLSLIYYNKLHDEKKAKDEMEKSFSMDESDARVLFELDQLYKVMERDPKERLEFLEAHKELLPTRDDLYTEYISLLNTVGYNEKAYNLIKRHKFHPWEGGEGKITTEYKRALIAKASDSENPKEAKELIEMDFNFPENLGEGKLIGELDNDLYWYLAKYTEDESKKHELLELAARGETNFSSARYYNDQPPEMMYFRALALNALGREKEAKEIADGMVAYGKEHMDDKVGFDFFAVSLPDFLIYEQDLCKMNVKHCRNMIALGEKLSKECNFVR